MMKNTHAMEDSRRVSGVQKFADDKMQELGTETLYRCQELDATGIQLDVYHGVISLSGTVQDEDSIRIAENCLKNIEDLRGIENNLEVRSSVH